MFTAKIFAVMPIYTNFEIMNINFTTDYKLKEKTFSIFFPANMNDRLLHIHDCYFDIYGTALISKTSLNLLF